MAASKVLLPETPLIIAARAGDVPKVRELLQAGARIDDAPRGVSALNAAAEAGKAEVVSLLIKAGHRPFFPFKLPPPSEDAWYSRSDRTAFVQEIENQNPDAVDLLYRESTKIDPTSKGAAVFLAASVGDIPTLKRLRKLGAPLNYAYTDRMHWHGETPVTAALDAEKPEAARYLLEEGADPRMKTHHATTALHAAAEKGFEGIAKLLLEKGAEVDARDSQERTPLIIACQHPYPEVIKVLLDHGAQTDVKDVSGLGPREQLAKSPEVLKLLDGR